MFRYMTFFHMELCFIIGSEILRDYDNHVSLSSSPASIAGLSAQCHLNLEAVKLVLVQPWGNQYPRASLSTQLVLVDISREENNDVKKYNVSLSIFSIVIAHVKTAFLEVHVNVHNFSKGGSVTLGFRT